MASTNRGRVLVIDDEEFVGRGIQRLLSREHEVVFEIDSARGLARATSEPFDVILCDVGMPGLSGIDVYESLAKTSPEAAKRMVFLTGGILSDRASELRTAVDNLWLDKPVGAAVLTRVVRERVG